MFATALENNGAKAVYIAGRRKDVLDKAVKENNVRIRTRIAFASHSAEGTRQFSATGRCMPYNAM